MNIAAMVHVSSEANPLGHASEVSKGAYASNQIPDVWFYQSSQVTNGAWQSWASWASDK